MEKQKISSGSPWEEIVGYSRAIKIANTIEISGTVATDNSGEVVGVNDLSIQTKFILLKIEETLKQLGASKKDVIRTRMFVTNIKDWEKAGRAHGEFFKDINPVTTMVEVSNLIGPEYLIEIEATAVVS